MARSRPTLPPCYALVHPGLEALAAEEITTELAGQVKKTGRGVVVFRVEEIDSSLLSLRTVEDVFLLAWGTDQLSYRALDLDKIRRWTAREVDWDHLLRLHHQVRPRPRGRPTYRLVTQMEGKHAYRRADAGEALARGLAGKFPASWKPAEENASVEVWLTIQGATVVCGLRLSDHTMRHRTWKREHRPASLRPTVAAAMVRLAGISPTHTVLDPMCGVGTLLAEHLAALPRCQPPPVLGGDLEHSAVWATACNLRRLGPSALARWDARHLPLPPACTDRILCNPPFGKQLGRDEDIAQLYREVIAECDRVLRPGGRAVFVVGDARALRAAGALVGWNLLRQLTVRLLGQETTITVWRKPEGSDTI
jgi:tRNA (guanine6-N2)-methyltransferase